MNARAAPTFSNSLLCYSLQSLISPEDIIRKLLEYVSVGTVVVLLSAGIAPAEPGNLQAFERMNGPLWTANGQAMAAKMCSLRSEDWVRSLSALLISTIHGSDFSALSAADQKTAEADGARLTHAGQAEFFGEDVLGCTKLKNSETLDMLDRMEASAPLSSH